jgi:hypothetical protein
VTIDRLLRDHHAELRRLLAEARSARADVLEPAFAMLADAVEIEAIVMSRHLHPLLQRLGYPDLSRALEIQRALCLLADDLRNLCEPGPHFAAALHVLAARLEQHIVDSERRVLPFVERQLPAAWRERLADEMNRTLDELEDELWLGVTVAWRQSSSAS